MAATAIAYAGLGLGLVGLLSLVRPLRFLRVRNRRRAAALLGLGLLLLLTAAILPAPRQGVETPTTRLDEFVPEWQFAERHEIRIHAPPERVEEAARAVTAREIRLFLLLTRIRHPRLPWKRTPESILAPSPDRPILQVALESGFLLLAEEPEREIAFGTLVLLPAELRRLPPAERERLRARWSPAMFRDLSEPGFAKAGMNFLLFDEGDGWTRLVTETRVFATDAGARRRFALYWRLIYPGSALIRRMWLAAIRDRAEAPA